MSSNIYLKLRASARIPDPQKLSISSRATRLTTLGVGKISFYEAKIDFYGLS